MMRYVILLKSVPEHVFSQLADPDLYPLVSKIFMWDVV